MAKTLAEIALQLEEPFPVGCVELLPKGKIEKDGKTLCMGLPYADVRVYEDRLNSLVPGEWSTPPPTAIVAGQKLIVYVTVIVCGVPHSDVGEAFLVSDNGNPSENAATESWAQAFKRACSQFGLGRYLYDLEKAWVPYNKQRRQIDLDGVGIARIVSGMYKKAGLCGDTNKNGGAQSNVAMPADQSQAQTPSTPQQTQIKALLQEFYNLSPQTYARIPNWEEIAIRTALVLGKTGTLPTNYTDEDIKKMRDYVEEKKAKAKKSVEQQAS